MGKKSKKQSEIIKGYKKWLKSKSNGREAYSIYYGVIKYKVGYRPIFRAENIRKNHELWFTIITLLDGLAKEYGVGVLKGVAEVVINKYSVNKNFGKDKNEKNN